MDSLLITGSDIKNRTETAKTFAARQSSDFDLIVFDTAEYKGIELAREVVKTTAKKPFQSKVTSIIVLEANKLTTEAQNALLKILEEPNETTQIILTAPIRDSLLPTVASRLFEIKAPENSEIVGVNFENLNEQSLSSKLEIIEKSKREDYLAFWSSLLTKQAVGGGDKLKSIHHYNKLLLKMVKAEKSSVNKKLIDLILALEVPKI